MSNWFNTSHTSFNFQTKTIMKLLLKRIARREKYTIGKLYINGEYFSDCIEDKDRGLTQDMPLDEIKKVLSLVNIMPISILAEDFLDYLMFLDIVVFSCILETRQSTPAAA